MGSRARWAMVAAALATSAWAQPTPPVMPELRVCVANLAYPPLITLDPARPGLRERQIVEAGAAAGVKVRLAYFPIRRCHRMVQDGELDAVYLAATPQSLAEFRFPRDPRGQPDRALRITEEAVMLVARRDSAFAWDGRAFTSTPRLGTRAGLRMAHEAAARQGLSVDDSAFDAAQALRKLHAQRHDLVLLLQADVDQQRALMEQLDLVVLPKPLATFDGFMGASPKLSPDREAALHAWWRALPRWRP